MSVLAEAAYQKLPSFERPGFKQFQSVGSVMWDLHRTLLQLPLRRCCFFRWFCFRCCYCHDLLVLLELLSVAVAMTTTIKGGGERYHYDNYFWPPIHCTMVLQMLDVTVVIIIPTSTILIIWNSHQDQHYSHEVTTLFRVFIFVRASGFGSLSGEAPGSRFVFLSISTWFTGLAGDGSEEALLQAVHLQFCMVLRGFSVQGQCRIGGPCVLALEALRDHIETRFHVYSLSHLRPLY